MMPGARLWVRAVVDGVVVPVWRIVRFLVVAAVLWAVAVGLLVGVPWVLVDSLLWWIR